MKRTSIAISFLLLVAACGGSKPEPAKPDPQPTVGGSDGTGGGSAAVEPTPPEPTPPEPVKPAPPPEPDPEQIKADLLAAETSAWGGAKPVFDKFCSGCHTETGKKQTKKKLAHFNFTAYPTTGEHAAMIGPEIREVLGTTGKKATMPQSKPGSVKGDELALIIAWADAWDAAEKGGAHPAAAASGEHKH